MIIFSPLLVMLFLIGIIGLSFFFIFPQIDIELSSYFWMPGWYPKIGWPGLIYNAVNWLVPLILFVLLALWFYTVWSPKKTIKQVSVIFLLVCLIIGPGFFVNAVFKDHWGRPRPSEITHFQGNESFVLPFVISQGCQKNSSFVCGHASVGFVLLALAYVYPRRRYLIAISSFSLGWMIGYVRMMQGGHFFSDVFFSWLVTWFVIHSIYLIFRRFGYDIEQYQRS